MILDTILGASLGYVSLNYVVLPVMRKVWDQTSFGHRVYSFFRPGAVVDLTHIDRLHHRITLWRNGRRTSVMIEGGCTYAENVYKTYVKGWVKER